MDAATWIGVVLGVWGAGLSTYLAYRTSRRENPALGVELGSWTDSTPLEDRDVTAGLTLSIRNIGIRPLTVKEIWLELSDGGARGVSGLIIDRLRKPSDRFPKKLEDGDGAEFFSAYYPWMENLAAIRVDTASGRTFRVEERFHRSDRWILIDAMLRLDLAAKTFGLKPGHEAKADPVQTLCDAGMTPEQVIYSRIFLDELRTRMQSESPEMAVAKVAMEFEKREQLIGDLVKEHRPEGSSSGPARKDAVDDP